MGAKAVGSSPSYHGVGGRYGWEDAGVTQGGLVASDRQGRVESVRQPQTNGRATANATIDLEPPGGRCGDKRQAKFPPRRGQEAERGL